MYSAAVFHRHHQTEKQEGRSESNKAPGKPAAGFKGWVNRGRGEEVRSGVSQWATRQTRRRENPNYNEREAKTLVTTQPVTCFGP